MRRPFCRVVDVFVIAVIQFGEISLNFEHKNVIFLSKISYWIANDDGIAQNCWPLYLPLPCVYDLWHLIQFSFANSFSARLALRKIMHLIDSHLRFTIWRPPDHPFPMKYDDYLFSTGAKHSLQPISFFFEKMSSVQNSSLKSVVWNNFIVWELIYCYFLKP